METGGNFTMRGAMLLLFSLFVAVAGFTLQEVALLRVGLLFVFLVSISALVAVWNLQKVEVALQSPSRAEAGKRFRVQVSLRNQRRLLDCCSAKVCLEFVDDLELNGLARWVSTQSEVVLDLPVVVNHRACVMEVKCRVESFFPFGLFRRVQESVIVLSPPTIIYPRKLIPRELLESGALNSESEMGGVMSGVELADMRGIRPWRAGDSAKHIHWPASARSLARGHDLRVREFDPPSLHSEHCHLVFHSYGKAGAMLREDRFERAMSYLAGSLYHFQSLGMKSTLHADFLAWLPHECSSRKELIEINALLAQLERGEGTEMHDIQRVLDRAGKNDCVLVVSDIELAKWADGLKLSENVILVDIRQVRFSRRQVNPGKGAVSA